MKIDTMIITTSVLTAWQRMGFPLQNRLKFAARSSFLFTVSLIILIMIMMIIFTVHYNSEMLLVVIMMMLKMRDTPFIHHHDNHRQHDVIIIAIREAKRSMITNDNQS